MPVSMNLPFDSFPWECKRQWFNNGEEFFFNRQKKSHVHPEPIYILWPDTEKHGCKWKTQHRAINNDLSSKKRKSPNISFPPTPPFIYYKTLTRSNDHQSNFKHTQLSSFKYTQTARCLTSQTDETTENKVRTCFYGTDIYLCHRQEQQTGF